MPRELCGYLIKGIPCARAKGHKHNSHRTREGMDRDNSRKGRRGQVAVGIDYAGALRELAEEDGETMVTELRLLIERERGTRVRCRARHG